MRHTPLFSGTSLTLTLIATFGVCQTSSSAPYDGAFLFPVDLIAEETPAPLTAEEFVVAPITNSADSGMTSIDFIAPTSSTQQSDFFPMIWSWMQAYPAWAGFFCVALLSSLVYFWQTMFRVPSMEDGVELADSYMEEKQSFSQAVPEVAMHEEEMQEQGYESSHSTTPETETQLEEQRTKSHSSIS
jgi:hypothetical protein